MNTQEIKKEKVYQRGRGGSDAQHKEDERLFHQLLVRHEEIERHTKKIENGIESITRIKSKDKELIEILQEHVLGMKKRFDANRAIRSWDPLFVELFDHRKELEMSWEILEDGIKVRLSSENKDLCELIKLHDETLHAFIEHGLRASKHESPYRFED